MRQRRGVVGNRFSKDRRGVSEIIGDILLVSIAVVMVAALAAQMGTVEQPKERPMVNLTATYDGTNITVAHMGGDALNNMSTRMYVFSNGLLQRNLNVTDGLPGDTSWGIGEVWGYTYATASTDQVRLQVLDTVSMTIVLDQILQRGPDSATLPDLGLLPANITITKNYLPIDESNNTPMDNDTITINATIMNWGGAGAANVLVRITDYSSLDKLNYNVGNLTIPWINATSGVNVTINYSLKKGSWGPHTMNVKVIPIYNETRFANNYASRDYRVGYLVQASSPTSPVLGVRAIDFSNTHPIHGNSIMISSRISNQGGVPAHATVRYYDNNKTVLIGTETGLGVPVGGESLSSIIWKTSSGGLHTIIVNVTDPNGTGGELSKQIEVLPTILLVDDDRAGEGGLRDVITPMEAALESVGASYTLHYVSGGDGPLYDAGEHPLKDFDLVIWLSGYESTNTLTANDQSSLTKYMYNSHGRLWLIGQDIVSNLGVNNPFLNNVMKIDNTMPVAYLDAGTPDPVIGVDLFSGSEFNFTSTFPTGLSNQGDYLKVTNKAKVALAEKGGSNRPVSLIFNATTNGTPNIDTYRAALFSFEFSKIKRSNDRSLITYEMLRWFNCSAKWGRDLSISDQEFDIQTPSFMDEVNITVYVRNNGLNNEPPDFISPILQIGFYVDGIVFDPTSITVDDHGTIWKFDQPSSEIWLPQSTPDPNLHIDKEGGYIKVSMTWVANKVGSHSVTVKVDPYDYIEEINEYNNRLSSAIANEVLYVRYGLLLVDDDQSANNGGANYNASLNVSSALDTLGYDYDIHVVMGAATMGPPLSKLELYNAIIWVAGQTTNSLTADDKANLTAFLKRGDGRYLWLIGQDAVNLGNYSDGSDLFYRDFLRTARVLDPVGQKTPSSIEGAYLDPFAHGARYPAQPAFADSGAILVPYIDGEGAIYQAPMPDLTKPNEKVYEDAQDGQTTGWGVRVNPLGSTNVFANLYDSGRASNVISLNRTGVNVQNTVFILGDFSPSNNQNTNDLPWIDMARYTAQWSFKFAMNYTVQFHVTDDLGAHHTLSYSDADADALGAEPVHHGLGAWTANGIWHTATRDLQRDLQDGTGWSTRTIRSVDGFEVSINVGSGMVDDLQLSRPFNSVRYTNETYNFKTVFTAWDLSFVSFTGNQNYSSELAFQIMRWFDMYDIRKELRITPLDLYYDAMLPIRELKPMIGQSYVLKAMVWNPGGSRADAVVRFSDGTTIIDSVSVSVEAEGRSLVEIVWTPLFAGSRSINVWVDPDNMVTEIFKFNNRAVYNLQTYFFYDDLESGTKNFKHEATIAHLSGESALDFLDAGTVNTSVISTWSQMDGFYNTTDNMSQTNISSTYHSFKKSFYMHEPKLLTQKPVDVVIVIDRSGSMGGQPLTDCKNAAKIFIDQLSNIDRVSVWSYESGVVMNIGFTFNKPAAKLAVDGIVVGGMTAGWTAMTQAVNYCINNGRADAVKCVVFLTDGNFNNDVNPYTKANTLIAIGNLHGPLFTIGLGFGINTVDLTDAAAASTGGQYYNAPTSAQLAGIYQAIAQVIADIAQSAGRSSPEGAAGERADIIFTDDFETAKAWTITNAAGAGSTWVRTNTMAHAGTYSYRCFNTATGQYVNGELDYLVSPVFDLTGYIEPYLSFWSYEAVESGYDYTTVQISNDSGTTWTQVWSQGTYTNAWQLRSGIDLSLGGFVGSTNQMRVRFQFTSDGSVVYAGWAIDDLVINASRPPPPPPPQAPPAWNNGDEVSKDRNLTTSTFSLLGVQNAKLTFWHKYNIKPSANGGVLMVGVAAAAAGPYSYKYITPLQPYPGNLKISEWGTPHLNDSYSNPMRWCWNGISGAGKFTWDYVEADLTQFVGNQYVRVKFAYLFCDGGSGWGWAIDDVEVKVQRSDSVAVTAASDDQWELVTKGSSLGGGGGDTADAYSGTHAWLCHNTSATGVDYLKGGIDNSLITVPIDLTRALNARLDVRFKFNINYTEGRPPDGFRVEVTSNNGETWRALNRGVRSAWKVSGTEAAGPDGTSGTGVNLGDNWVESGTLARLNCDLTGWAGSVIQIRFRVTTRTDMTNHYDSNAAGFGGFYIDDVTVTGNTTTGRAMASSEARQDCATEDAAGTASADSGAEQTPCVDANPANAGSTPHEERHDMAMADAWRVRRGYGQ